MTQVRIEYDDDQLNVVDKINTALERHGLVFVDDGLPHDGYCILTLQTVAKANDAPAGSAGRLGDNRTSK
jgi:hypothetical protein